MPMVGVSAAHYAYEIHEAWKRSDSLWYWRQAGGALSKFGSAELLRHRRRRIDKTPYCSEDRLRAMEHWLACIPWLLAYEDCLAYEREVWSVQRQSRWKGNYVPIAERDAFKKRSEEAQFRRDFDKSTKPLRDAKRELRHLVRQLQWKKWYDSNQQLHHSA